MSKRVSSAVPKSNHGDASRYCWTLFVPRAYRANEVVKWIAWACIMYYHNHRSCIDGYLRYASIMEVGMYAMAVSKAKCVGGWQ